MNALPKFTIPAHTTFDTLEVIRLEANVGAEIRGLDLRVPPTEAVATLLRDLLWRHQVLFFRDTGLDDSGQSAVARVFGPPVADSIARRRGVKDEDVTPMHSGPYANAYYGTPWHADATYLEKPYLASVLRSVIAPELGGDTIYASGISAYEALPKDVKRQVEGLTAIHRPNGKAYKLIEDKADLDDYLKQYCGVVHPIVTTHPYSGKKVLYVNEGFTHEIVGLPEDEGKDLLEYLVRRFYEPEHQVRFKWQPGSLAIWDNRAVQHKGIADYGYARRELVRVVAGGDRPIAA